MLSDIFDATHKPIYTTDTEYRDCIRKVFRLKDIEPDCNHLADDETRDELNYDDETMSSALNIIFEKTAEIPTFSELYLLAAAKMISEDREIGLVILVSYDFFPWFHACLEWFLRTGELKSSDSCFIEMKAHLSSK
jgi:hypothetical protein